MRKNILTIASAALVLAGCTGLDDAEYVVLQELAAEVQEAVAPATGGKVSLPVYSNGTVTVRALNDFGGYATLDKNSFKGDDVLNVDFTANTGFRRMAKLEISLNGGEKLDTLYAKQEGIVPYLECVASYGTVNGSAPGTAEFSLLTNIPLDDLARTVSYVSGAEGWVSQTFTDVDKIIVQTATNPSDHISKACIKVGYVDGWDVELGVNLFVTASDRGGEFGTARTFAQVRELAGKGVIEEDYFVEGVVVSDWHSLNMGLNPAVNYDEVDVAESLRTAYIQSPDGTMGMRLRYLNADDNKLVFGTKVTLSLQGLSVEKESNPDRYTVQGLESGSMVHSEEGTGVEPKVRAIGELVPDDIYTWVSLKDTEFECKEGSFANVYENYVLKSEVNSMCSGNNNRMDGWAIMLVDKAGSSIYAPVNMLCTWRRDGSGVPQGVGPTTGVIVSENIHRYGDVGPYQIRVHDKAGFGQEWKGESAYTTWAKWNGSPDHYRFGVWGGYNSKYKAPTGIENRLKNSIIPSDDICATKPNPNAELVCLNWNKQASQTDSSYPIASANSYCCPFCTNSGIGDRGIASASNADTNPKSMYLQHEIKGWFDWDSDGKVTGYRGLKITTSTASLSGSVLRLSYAYSVGSVSATTSQNFPAHWCVEYSIDGGKTFKICPDSATGKEYTHLHTLPWWDANVSGIKYFTAGACGMGNTEHNVVLGADAFGVDNLIINIRPYDDVMSVFPIEWNADTETARVRRNTSANTYINFEYINIRYR